MVDSTAESVSMRTANVNVMPYLHRKHRGVEQIKPERRTVIVKMPDARRPENLGSVESAHRVVACTSGDIHLTPIQ